jgi:hypothetical protein
MTFQVAISLVRSKERRTLTPESKQDYEKDGVTLQTIGVFNAQGVRVGSLAAKRVDSLLPHLVPTLSAYQDQSVLIIFRSLVT